MNEGLVPGRYAKALLKFAQEHGVAPRVYQLMNNLALSFAENPQLEATIVNPFIASDKKMQLLATGAGAEKQDEAFADFLKLLKQNNRLPLARAIANGYINLYRKANNIYKVNVSAAAKMDKESEARLKAMIQSHLNGGTMEYNFTVNPDLIGGFTVDIGSERLDASIKNELKQLQLKLLS